MNEVEYAPCECCERTDQDTGHGLCGFPYMCSPCLLLELEVNPSEDEILEHKKRHEGE